MFISLSYQLSGCSASRVSAHLSVLPSRKFNKGYCTQTFQLDFMAPSMFVNMVDSCHVVPLRGLELLFRVARSAEGNTWWVHSVTWATPGRFILSYEQHLVGSYCHMGNTWWVHSVTWATPGGFILSHGQHLVGS